MECDDLKGYSLSTFCSKGIFTLGKVRRARRKCKQAGNLRNRHGHDDTTKYIQTIIIFLFCSDLYIRK